MEAALDDHYFAVFVTVDEAVFPRNSPRPISGQLMLQWLWVTDTVKRVWSYGSD